MKTNNVRRIWVAVVLVALGVLGACGGDDDDGGTSTGGSSGNAGASGCVDENPTATQLCAQFASCGQTKCSSQFSTCAADCQGYNDCVASCTPCEDCGKKCGALSTSACSSCLAPAYECQGTQCSAEQQACIDAQLRLVVMFSAAA